MLEALNLSPIECVIYAVFLVLFLVIIAKLSNLSHSVDEHSETFEEVVAEIAPEIKRGTAKKPPAPVVAESSPAPVVYGHGVELYKVDEQSAATIMAIVSHQTGIPLNRLQFNSIRLDDSLELYKTDYKSAACIMAIVSHQTGIPLERLNFKSIKLCDAPELYKTDEETAAKVMAITSKESGIPLDRLVFKSIKLIEK